MRDAESFFTLERLFIMNNVGSYGMGFIPKLPQNRQNISRNTQSDLERNSSIYSGLSISNESYQRSNIQVKFNENNEIRESSSEIY